MGFDVVLVFVILAGAVALFASDKVPADLVAILVLGSLVVLRLVTPEEGISGFANPATVTVAAMFVLTAGLQKTGATLVVGRLLLRFADRPLLALLVMTTMVGLLSAFVNNTAAVAVFIPLVVTLAARSKIAASKFLLPLSYASQFGGVCTLIGTSTNLLVSAISERAGHGAFSMFELSRFGLVLFVAGTLYFLLFSRWLLPTREARALAETFQLGHYITEVRVGEGSPLVGRSVHQSRLGEMHDVTVLRRLRGTQRTWAPLHQAIEAGDVLLVRGGVAQLMELKAATGLELNVEFKLGDATLEADDQRLVQALVPPQSPLAGHTLRELDFHRRFGGMVLAILRHGQSLAERLSAVRLELGDVLLIQAPEAELRRLRADEALLVLDQVESPSQRRHKAPVAIGILAAVVLLAGFGVLPILVGSILGVVALVLSRCLALDEAYAAIDLKVIALLAGVLPLGIALEKTGVARLISETVLGWADGMGPVGALAAVYLVTAVLTELMSNNATAVLLAPIAIATAEELGVDPRPFLMAVTFAASTSFSTPVGYQTNAMVYNAGGYRYTDFLRAGVPLNLLFWALAVWLIPRFWSF